MTQVTKQISDEQINLKLFKKNLKRLKVAVRGHLARIEQRTGCTKGAVSAVLNNNYQGSQETKEKIIQAAKEVAEEVQSERAKTAKRIVKLLA